MLSFALVHSAAAQNPFGGDAEKPLPFLKEGGEPMKMHAWYCSQQGNEEELPCLVQKLRSLPKGADRDALQAKIREAPKGRGTDSRDAVSKMHQGWCALAENAESKLCLKWTQSAARRQEAAAERKKSPTHRSEYVDMHTAYCDENPKNAETFPCLTHRMRSTDAGSEERDKLLQQLKAASPDDRTSQREDMMRFWCEDPTTNRSESGVCLSWRKRSQLSALHTPEKLKAMGEKPGAMLKENQPFNQMRSELERMHEWYCTNLDGTHDLPLCARWRLRLRGAVRRALTRTPD